MLKLFTIWAGCFLLLCPKVFSQSSSSRQKIIPVVDSIQVDTLSLVPGTVYILSGKDTLKTEHFSVDFAKSVLTWVKKPETSTVEIHYQVFPFLFTKRYSNRQTEQIQVTAIDNSEFNKKPLQEESGNTLFNVQGLTKSGSISRSVGVGNNQDLALNSNMALQLSGKITEDLEITAAISDDNIPIQPEGNTQQINDFDKVFIQLKRKNSSLTGGDFELRRPDSYFMNFYKRTQGGSFSTSYSSKGWNYKSSLSAAIAKGRSTRQLFNGTEGNQGPYRLAGNNGEQSIIVLSGTERIFLDGTLLTRGQENDYVIDYNTAEITFTAKRLITRNSRIVAEFEYSDKNYSRSLTYFNQEAANSKVAFKFNFYNEQDNRNQPFLQDITEPQKQFLKTVGNSINLAYYPNVDTVPFNENEILYKQIDTLGQSGVYVYSTDPALAKYRLGFSFVGANNGNYQLSTTSAANGRVFEFIPPIAGIKQGSYEPVTLIITPKKQQLITMGTEIKAFKNTSIHSEIAFSNNDVNLFSDIGNKQNQGLALKLSAKNETVISKADSVKTRLITTASYEQTSSNFKPLERYRSVEFERDFNLNSLSAGKAEHLGTFGLSLFKDASKNVSYLFSTFIRDGIYTGFQNSIDGTYRLNSFQLTYNGKILNSSSSLTKGTFLRQRADISRQVKWLVAGLNFEQEHNNTRAKTNNLTSNSFAFDAYKAYLKSSGSSPNSFKLEYGKRYDKLPYLDKLRESSIADVISGELGLNKNPNSILSVSSTYRNIKYRNDTINENESTLLGRVDYTLNILKGFINTNIFYELGPGREPKRDFSYLEVITGQGVYTWNDYNNNGIKELNEFEIARYKDQARYIRIFQNTNQFVNTDYTTINYTLRLTPSLLWRNKKGFYEMLSRFSTQSAFKAERKSSGLNGFSAYNPFAGVTGENLISDNTFFRNTLFFNRNNAVYGIDFNFQLVGNKLLLINGFDTRNRREEGIRLRWNIKKTSLILETKSGLKRYQSELFSEKNYRITFLGILPEASYQFNNNFRIGLNASYRKQKNNIGNKEDASNYKLGSDLRYNILRRGTLNAGINLVKNDFNGDKSSSLAYEMLEGLQPGNNMIWNAGLQHTVAQGVQINVGYEGRKSSDVQTIHTGSIQFRAFF